MEAILRLIQQGNIQAIVALWLLLIGFSVVVYIAVEQYRRQSVLRRFGIRESEDSQQEKAWMLALGKYVTGLFSTSESDIGDKFIAAGFYDTRYAHLLMPVKYGVMILGLAAIAMAGVSMGYPLLKLLPIMGGWLVVSILLPDMYLAQRTRHLRRKLSGQLPYLLDLMGVCVQTGMTIEAAMSYLTQEMISFDRDLAYMLKRTTERAQIVGMEKALDELYKRVPTTEIRSFVMTLNQSLQYGSSIYSVLTTLAVDIRQVQMLGMEEKIGKLSAKMSVPLILFIMIPIVILIAAPGVMRLMN
ncbi:biotin synthase [Vibrio sp. HA2012]|uniref:type II secretion system F family protein n=1 Tax=Vibrio sp. HA2012 TaxID=1971595 RepID=UPI000C2CD6A5|nr:type II secretion system F family protein [Vibrio sp. HA2012]PJC86093.1 biotin synthase [Vibrio sp. HA2012]